VEQHVQHYLTHVQSKIYSTLKRSRGLDFKCKNYTKYSTSAAMNCLYPVLKSVAVTQVCGSVWKILDSISKIKHLEIFCETGELEVDDEYMV